LSDVFPPEKRGRIIGIHEMAAPAGMVLGPVITGILLTLGLNWNGTLQVWAIPTMIVLALQLVFLRGVGQREETNMPARKDDPPKSVVEKSGAASSPRSTRILLLIVLAMILRNVASMGMNLLPVFWVADYGVAISTAAFVFGIVRIFSIFGQAGAGYLSDIFGRTRVMLMLQIAASIMWVPSFYLPFGPYLFISLSIVSIFSYGFMPVIFSYMSDTSRSTAERARMIGIIQASSGVGGVINPTVIGYLVDKFSYQIAWLFPVTAAFSSIPILMLATRKIKTKPAG
jgi:MFS family permease